MINENTLQEEMSPKVEILTPDSYNIDEPTERGDTK